jgi:hypothetical protein
MHANSSHRKPGNFREQQELRQRPSSVITDDQSRAAAHQSESRTQDPMPTLDWIGKDAVVRHHKDVPYRLLEPV